jgi:hypothetical protein
MQATRLSRLYATRWPDKCERPCAAKVHCSCYHWALERTSTYSPSISYNPTESLRYCLIALVALGIPFACVAIVAVCATCF